jgi:hypothetical protein
VSSGPDGRLKGTGKDVAGSNAMRVEGGGVIGIVGMRKGVAEGVPGAASDRGVRLDSAAFDTTVDEIAGACAMEVVSNGSFRADSKARFSCSAARSPFKAAAATTATDASLVSEGRAAPMRAGLTSRPMEVSRRSSRPMRREREVMSSRSRAIAASMLFIVRLTMSREDALFGGHEPLKHATQVSSRT